ncbi:lycopene cyclase domain-containing protein [Mucilaginibacter ximonensis]|uniref:Lycopene cyclase domain-containing protein n=1 Tax=Mucilaginibacter ximonensis TaxID=538021 RepID=A0ABW5YBF8_9SPHI
MISQTYILIDLLSVIVPLAASFHPASMLYRRWYALFPAIVITTIGYCIWDAWFTQMGIWGFNRHYLLGVNLWNLPLEEVLFFVCIPYACVFTFDSASSLIPDQQMSRGLKIFNIVLAVLFAIIAIIYRNNYYTASAFAVLALLVLLAGVKRVSWMKRFYMVYAVLLIPFLIVNGLLTGTGLAAPVVWYNNAEIIGPRILTIPVEDVFYGMGLVLVNVWIYQEILSKKNQIANAAIANG